MFLHGKINELNEISHNIFKLLREVDKLYISLCEILEHIHEIEPSYEKMIEKEFDIMNI